MRRVLALRLLPYGCYRAAQRQLGSRFDNLETYLPVYRRHAEIFRKIPGAKTAVEFGAGRSLLTPLLLSAAGAESVTTFDIIPMASLENVNHAIRTLRSSGERGDWREIDDLSDLRRYRIDYRAPGDIRRSGFETGSVDFICSTSTLEHIPRSQIVEIMAECRRIASNSAVLSFIIDYHDHYATADPSIGRFNFYRYPSWAWRFFNPANHFQNRLRHSDYMRLFSDFSAIEHTAILCSDPIGKLHRDFERFDENDLRAKNGVFVLSLAANDGR